MLTPSVCAIILAAGKGKRMNAKKTNKVALTLGDKPLVAHTLIHLREAGIKDIIAVVGFAAKSVKAALGQDVTYALQTKRLGTAHAVKIGLNHIPLEAQTVLTMYGDDSAFYPPALFEAIVSSHQKSQRPITLLTLSVKDPKGLGRIIRNSMGELIDIVEEKNATKSQRQLHEINTGLFCFNRNFITRHINQIRKNPVSHEYYLTDIVSLAVKAGFKVNSFTWPEDSIWFGINTPQELLTARQKIDRHLKPTHVA